MKNSSFIKIIIIGVVLGFGIKWLAFEAFTIPTESMEPTILRGDVVWINKVTFSNFNKNDIVGFEKNKENFIKRIVGVPMDSVYAIVKDEANEENNNPNVQGKYHIYDPHKILPINKIYTFYKIPQKGETIIFNKTNFDFYQSLIETYEGVQAGRLFDKIFINASESNSYTFKQNYYFVQGDNTEGSIDSRHWGLVAQSQLIGKSIYIQRKSKGQLNNILNVDSKGVTRL